MSQPLAYGEIWLILVTSVQVHVSAATLRAHRREAVGPGERNPVSQTVRSGKQSSVVTSFSFSSPYRKERQRSLFEKNIESPPMGLWFLLPLCPSACRYLSWVCQRAVGSSGCRLRQFGPSEYTPSHQSILRKYPGIPLLIRTVSAFALCPVSLTHLAARKALESSDGFLDFVDRIHDSEKILLSKWNQCLVYVLSFLVANLQTLLQTAVCTPPGLTLVTIASPVSHIQIESIHRWLRESRNHDPGLQTVTFLTRHATCPSIRLGLVERPVQDKLVRDFSYKHPVSQMVSPKFSFNFAFF